MAVRSLRLLPALFLAALSVLAGGEGKRASDSFSTLTDAQVKASIEPRIAQTEPCTFVSYKFAAKIAVRPSEFKQCLTEFPRDRNQVISILDTMWKTLVNIYPYTNLAHNSPSAQLPLKVRLRKRFIELKKANFSTDYKFHKGLYNVVNSLQDGHTSWEPDCYTKGVVLNAFPLIKVFNPVENAFVIKISPAIGVCLVFLYL